VLSGFSGQRGLGGMRRTKAEGKRQKAKVRRK